MALIGILFTRLESNFDLSASPSIREGVQQLSCSIQWNHAVGIYTGPKYGRIAVLILCVRIGSPYSTHKSSFRYDFSSYDFTYESPVTHLTTLGLTRILKALQLDHLLGR